MEISKRDFLNNKYNRYISRGDATKNGNPHLRVIMDEKGNTMLSIPFSKKTPTGKIERFTTPLYIPQKLS